MRGTLVGGMAGAIVLVVICVSIGFVSAAWDISLVPVPGRRPAGGQRFAHAFVCLGLTSVFADIIGFVYGMPLGCLVQKWSHAVPVGTGFFQAAFIGAIFGAIVSGVPICLLLAYYAQFDYHIVVGMVFVAAVSAYSMVTACVVRWRHNVSAMRLGVGDSKSIGSSACPPVLSTAIKSGLPDQRKGNGSADIFHK